MSTTDWGLTEQGFRRPTYAELLDAVEYKMRETFGAKANLTVRSPLGLFARIYTWMLNMVFSTIEDVYNSRFIDTSVGSSLYNLGRSIGLYLLPAQKASGYLLITGTPGVVVPAGWLAGTVEGYHYVVVTAGKIGTDGTASLLAQATITGADSNAEANTIKTIINPGIPEGITAVNNPAAFEGGRAKETDEEYRDRYYKSVDYAGGVNADAIRSEILQNVEGVSAVTIYENDTDDTDTDGLPPHSFEAIVYGGADGDIAKQIFKRKAAGIRTHGTTTVSVLSAGGAVYNVSFSRPAPVNVWVRITNLNTDSETFPSDGIAQIKAAIINYIGGSTTGGITIGGDVYYNRLPAVVYSVSGVLDFKLEISSNGTTYNYNNISVSSRQKAMTDIDKVTVS